MPSVVLGTGSIGTRHLHVLRDLISSNVRAVPVRAARIAELEQQGYGVFDGLQAAMIDGARAVVIATDTARHLADLQSALEWANAVLVEKPLAARANEITPVAASITNSGKQVYVACDLRFDPSLLCFRANLGKIGRVHTVRIECQSYLPDWRPDRDYRQSYSARAEEGGVLLDLIHEIDYAVWLFGPPQRVFAKLTNSGSLGIQSEEAVDLLWDTQAGTTISIRLDYVTRSSHRTMHAYGECGEIAWDGVEQSVLLELLGAGAQRYELRCERHSIMRDQDSAFLRAAAGGDPGTLTTFSEGAFAVSVCDAARRSSESGRVEDVIHWSTE